MRYTVRFEPTDDGWRVSVPALGINADVDCIGLTEAASAAEAMIEGREAHNRERGAEAMIDKLKPSVARKAREANVEVDAGTGVVRCRACGGA